MARTTPERLSLREARRVALAAQGFDRARPRGRVDVRHLRRTIEQLGLLQIDSVNVLVPAHYLPLFSRLGPYSREQLNDLVYRRREYTETWAHEAAILPVARWGLIQHHWETGRRFRALAEFMKQHVEFAANVLEEIRARGPLTAADLPEPDGTRGKATDWWGWTKAKATLEGLFAQGALAIADRRTVGFARAYDLAERIVPDEHRRPASPAEARRELLTLAGRALGIATAADLADYYRIFIGDARPAIAELVEEGVLQPMVVEGWKEPAYLHRGARIPRSITAAALLSPFDPVVWFRPRATRLFDFDYRLEIYTPSAKRRWGYYVLPFLLGERIAARVDLKADRSAGRLLVLAAHREAHVPAREVAEPLAAELHLVARWLGLDEVIVERRGDLARALAGAVRGARDANSETEITAKRR